MHLRFSFGNSSEGEGKLSIISLDVHEAFNSAEYPAMAHLILSPQQIILIC